MVNRNRYLLYTMSSQLPHHHLYVTNIKPVFIMNATARPPHRLVAHCITFQGVRPLENDFTRLASGPV